jgi:D-amino-acid dehydrogenase
MKRIIVIGAGVIGLACAYALRKRGHDVVVVDRGLPGDACSSGNAGWIVPSLSGPLPTPGMTGTTLKWMLKSDSPLYISPAAAPGLARWLWRFWRYSNPTDYLKGLRAVAELNRPTRQLFDQLQSDGVPFELHRDGLLFVFLDPTYMRRTLADFEHFREFGYAVPTPIDGEDVRQLEPGLSRRVSSGFLVEPEYHVRPESLCDGYLGALRASGVRVLANADVTGGRVSAGKATVLETSSGPLEGSEFLIAAGAWSGQVTEQFGVRLPVQAGKGYSITIDGKTPPFTRPLYLGEARIGCSPFTGATRFAGTMELSGINTVLDRRRIQGIRRGIARYLDTSISPNEGSEWVGMRPLTPDGLPMLGRVPGFENLYVATGHAMLGVTLAPATAEIMADLITGTPPRMELAPFEPGRFHW